MTNEQKKLAASQVGNVGTAALVFGFVTPFIAQDAIKIALTMPISIFVSGVCFWVAWQFAGEIKDAQ